MSQGQSQSKVKVQNFLFPIAALRLEYIIIIFQ